MLDLQISPVVHPLAEDALTPTAIQEVVSESLREGITSLTNRLEVPWVQGVDDCSPAVVSPGGTFSYGDTPILQVLNGSGPMYPPRLSAF